MPRAGAIGDVFDGGQRGEHARLAVDRHGGDHDGALRRPVQLERLSAVAARERDAQVRADRFVDEHVGVTHAEKVTRRFVRSNDDAALVGHDDACRQGVEGGPGAPPTASLRGIGCSRATPSPGGPWPT